MAWMMKEKDAGWSGFSLTIGLRTLTAVSVLKYLIVKARAQML